MYSLHMSTYLLLHTTLKDNVTWTLLPGDMIGHMPRILQNISLTWIKGFTNWAVVSSLSGWMLTVCTAHRLEDDTAWHPVMPATAESWNPVSRLIVQTFLGSPLKLWASVGHWLLWHFDLSLYTEKQKPRVKLCPPVLQPTGLQHWPARQPIQIWSQIQTVLCKLCPLAPQLFVCK